MKKVSINQDVCIGCGACQSIANSVFEINDEGFAEVIKDVISKEEEDEVTDAAEGCPTDAIEIKEN